MIRAEADQVVWCVRSVMRPSEGTNVRRFGIRASGTLKARAAHLASEVVKSFEVGAQFGVADDAADRSLCARGYGVSLG